MHALQTSLKCCMAPVAGESSTFVWPSSSKVAAAKQVQAAGFSGYSLSPPSLFSIPFHPLFYPSTTSANWRLCKV